MTREDRTDQFVREAATDYNRPPETPREAMWERITAARHVRSLRPVLDRRWAWTAAAAAAVLVLGIAIGRYSAPSGGGKPPAAGQPAAFRQPPALASRPSVAHRLAATRHFSRAEVLLTQFRAQDSSQPPDELAEWARVLLRDTQLLLDSPAAADLEYRDLLEDLEFVLVQIVHARAERRWEERRWIADGLDQRGVMERLRLLTPVLPAGAGT